MAVTTIAQQLEAAFTAVQLAVNQMPPQFTSHKFLQEFSHHNEELYLRFLSGFQRSKGVRAVNSQIGRFLSTNSDRLGITKTGKTNDHNFFGKKTGNERWVKI